ncbi:unnamed protein product [Schistosoma mattheei]|uniref:Uncharacterized protein n=1 Tax=Schistosoma mattheei TaxID=31246 RepID=A0A183PRK1_9TREM|nr:unnamed protein product [Schistosoma mattheei]
MKRLDTYSDFDAFEDYFERFEIWATTKEDDEDVNIAAHFFTFIGKEAYRLLKTLALPRKPISLPYTALKELLLDCIKDMVFPNDSLISDEVPYKSEENMLSEHNYDQKPDVVLIDADSFNDPLLCNDILNKFEEGISEESNCDVISNIICLHNAFVSCEKLVQCEAQVLNELEFD